MKKLIYTLFAVLFSLPVFAANGPVVTPFNDNLEGIEQQFDRLNALEQEVTDCQYTLSDLQTLNHGALSTLNQDSDYSNTLLGAGTEMDPTLKWVLIIGISLIVLGCGCILLLNFATY